MLLTTLLVLGALFVKGRFEVLDRVLVVVVGAHQIRIELRLLGELLAGASQLFVERLVEFGEAHRDSSDIVH